MAMPPTPGSQNAVIYGSSAKPTSADLGMFGTLVGGTVTGMTTEFPYTHDVYHDIYMNRIVDIGHDFQFVLNVDFEVLLKTASGTFQPALDSVMAESITASAIECVNYTDTRGFCGSSGTPAVREWASGSSFLLTEGGGTFERNKPRKDRLKLEYRRYST
jgi:hypothetical protein